MKIKNLVVSLIKTDDMDQFLRALKLFYINNSKRLYSLLTDYLLQTLVTNPLEVKAKKEVFKYVSAPDDPQQALFSAFMLLALLMS